MKPIKLVKLLNGEELLTEVGPLVNGEYVLTNPVKILVFPSNDPQSPRIALAAWSQFSLDKEFTIDKSHVIAIMNPVDEFKKQYESMFSPLTLPQQNKLILPKR